MRGIYVRGGDAPYLVCDRHSELMASAADAAAELANAVTLPANFRNITIDSAVPHPNREAILASMSQALRDYMDDKSWSVQFANDHTGNYKLYIYDGALTSSDYYQKKDCLEYNSADGTTQTVQRRISSRTNEGVKYYVISNNSY